MPRKGGNETVLGSTLFRCSPMRECDTYLEFCMSKDSIGAAEFGFGQSSTAQGQFKSSQGAKMSPWLHPGCTLATFKLSLCCTRLTKSKFSCTNKILRHAEFQICITLLHWRASVACRTQNSFIPTFSGHWSPA